MSFRSTTKMLAGAAAVMAVSAGAATAQTSPTSTRRIPISKEAPGEVVTREQLVLQI